MITFNKIEKKKKKSKNESTNVSELKKRFILKKIKKVIQSVILFISQWIYFTTRKGWVWVNATVRCFFWKLRTSVMSLGYLISSFLLYIGLGASFTITYWIPGLKLFWMLEMHLNNFFLFRMHSDRTGLR